MQSKISSDMLSSIAGRLTTVGGPLAPGAFKFTPYTRTEVVMRGQGIVIQPCDGEAFPGSGSMPAAQIAFAENGDPYIVLGSYTARYSSNENSTLSVAGFAVQSGNDAVVWGIVEFDSPLRLTRDGRCVTVTIVLRISPSGLVLEGTVTD